MEAVQCRLVFRYSIDKNKFSGPLGLRKYRAHILCLKPVFCSKLLVMCGVMWDDALYCFITLHTLNQTRLTVLTVLISSVFQKSDSRLVIFYVLARGPYFKSIQISIC